MNNFTCASWCTSQRWNGDDDQNNFYYDPYYNENWFDATDDVNNFRYYWFSFLICFDIQSWKNDNDDNNADDDDD